MIRKCQETFPLIDLFCIPGIKESRVYLRGGIKYLAPVRVLPIDDYHLSVLSELLTFSDCEDRKHACGFGEFAKPSRVEERNFL